MARLIAVATVATALVCIPAHAGGSRQVETVDYTGSSVGSVAGVTPYFRGGVGTPSKQVMSATAPTTSSDHTVRVHIADQTGLPVMADAVQYGPSGKEFPLGTVCGEDATFRIARPGRNVVFYLLTGTCGTATASTPTQGTITLTFGR